MVDVATCDSAASNLRVERWFSKRFLRIPRLTLRCEIHAVSGVQTKAFKTVDGDMSGIINLALAMQPSGSAAQLRSIMKSVIKGNLEIFPDAEPPQSDSLEVQHRTEVFDILFGRTPTDLKRKETLHALLNGSIDGDVIAHYGPIEVDQFCDDVAHILLPCAIQVFARHRWLNSTEAIRETSLLFNCCRLADYFACTLAS